MTVWVIRDGQLVEKAYLNARSFKPIFPTPMISRMEPFESPITGKTISSWRERDRDMKASDSIDPRDLPRGLKRGRAAQKREADNGRGTADHTNQRSSGT